MAIFGRFTERAQRALSAAQREAAELRQPYVGTEHLLLGLLKETDRLPAAIGTKVSYDRVRELLSVGDGDRVVSVSAPPLFELTPRAKKLLEQSIMESRRLGQSYVSVEHFWLAILPGGRRRGRKRPPPTGGGLRSGKGRIAPSASHAALWRHE